MAGAAMTTDDRSDDTLLAAWRHGDEAAGVLLYRRHATMVYELLRAKAPGAAEDLLQQTFMALLTSECQPRLGVRAYLAGIARNQARMHLRAEGRRARRFREGVWSFGVGAPQSGAMRRHELARALRSCLNELGSQTRREVEEHYLRRTPLAELAKRRSVGVGAVKMKLLRARRRLESALRSRRVGSSAARSSGGIVEPFVLPAIGTEKDLD